MRFMHSLLYKIMVVLFLVGGIQLEAGKSFAQQISMDATGAGIGVWNTDQGTYLSVTAADISSLGAWSAPVMISDVGEDCSHPRVVTNAGGDSVAVWSSANVGFGINVLRVAVRPAGGPWGAATQVSLNTESIPDFSGNLEDPAYDLKLSDTGIAVVLWNSSMSGNLVIRAARFTAGVWSAPTTVQP